MYTVQYARGQIKSPWLLDKNVLESFRVDSGVDIGEVGSQLRHGVPYTMFFFGFCLWTEVITVCKSILVLYLTIQSYGFKIFFLGTFSLNNLLSEINYLLWTLVSTYTVAYCMYIIAKSHFVFRQIMLTFTILRKYRNNNLSNV